MKPWPELLALAACVALCVTSIVFAEPPTVVAPWCPTVAGAERCSAEDCQSAADEECRKYVGPGHFSMAWCAKGGK